MHAFGRARRAVVVALCALLTGTATLVLQSTPAAALNAPIIVTTASDHDDGACTAKDCSLREAIVMANAQPGLDRIGFAIGNGGPAVITMAEFPLPPITDPVTIDGSTQPGYAGQPLVGIDGSQLGGFTTGIDVRAAGSTVRTLSVSGFTEEIVLSGGTDRLEGNYIGTPDDSAGFPRYSSIGVVAIGPGGDVIGGTSASARNLISGDSCGINIANSDGVQIIGNWIGIDASGTRAIGTSDHGFYGVCGERSAAIAIGGSDPGAGNVISGGIALGDVSSLTVERNMIGTDPTGRHALSGQFSGIALGRYGALAIRANIIDACSAGIQLFDGQHGTITDNLIGTDASGGALLTPSAPCRSDTHFGISASESGQLTIGGPGHGNVIGGFAAGVVTQSGPATVLGNWIGTDRTGSADLGNGIGIATEGRVSIGDGTAAGSNVIANNGTGIVTTGSDTHAMVRRNVLRTNDGLAIDVGAGDGQSAGVTPNDASDADGITNYPVLLASVDGQPGRIVGSLAAAAETRYDVDLYSNAQCDTSGHGEAETWLGSVAVTTDGAGHGFFDTHDFPVTRSRYLTATATGPDGTSELSACMATPGFNANDGDIATKVSAANLGVPAGGAFTVTQTITNRGTVAIPSSVASMQIPNGFRAESFNTSQGTCPPTAPPHCDLGILAPGVTATVIYHLIAGPKTASNLITVIAAGDMTDPNTINNRATQVVLVHGSLAQVVGIITGLVSSLLGRGPGSGSGPQ
jgi:CSLREA domain-containing protein